MTKKQIIAIANRAYGDGLVEYARAQGIQCGDSLAEFIAIELSETYVRAAPAEQLDEARRVMCQARRELERVEWAFEQELKKQKGSKED